MVVLVLSCLFIISWVNGRAAFGLFIFFFVFFFPPLIDFFKNEFWFDFLKCASFLVFDIPSKSVQGKVFERRWFLVFAYCKFWIY